MDRTILKSPYSLNERGFTAVELVTYIVLAGVTLGGALILFQSSMDTYVSVVGRSLALEEVHHAVRTIARDVQSVRDKNSITTANATTFTFVNTKNQTVSLSYASGQITRSGTVIVKNVTSFGLTYTKWDGTAWTSGNATSLIARVHLAMTAASGGQSITINESFLIRNTR